MSGFVRALSPEALRLLTTTPFARIANPDVGFELAICVNPMARMLMTQALRDAITGPVPIMGMNVSVVPPTTPLDIRFNCQDGERIGIWFPGAPAGDRDQALRLPPRRLPGENYAQTISLNAIRFVANNVWNLPITPKRITLPDPFEDARLSGFTITLERPNRIITTINGIIPIAVLPDARFQVTFTDTVGINGAGQLVCMAGTPQVNVDQAIVRAIFGSAVNRIANVFLGGRVSGMAGLGCRVLTLLAPGGINVPVAGRVDFPYSRVDVDSAGVTLGSRAPLAPVLQMARVMEEPFRAPR